MSDNGHKTTKMDHERQREGTNHERESERENTDRAMERERNRVMHGEVEALVFVQPPQSLLHHNQIFSIIDICSFARCIPLLKIKIK